MVYKIAPCMNVNLFFQNWIQIFKAIVVLWFIFKGHELKFVSITRSRGPSCQSSEYSQANIKLLD